MSAVGGTLRRPVRRPPLDLAKPLELVVFAVLPILATVVLAVEIFHAGDGAIDFRLAYLAAGRRVLHGGDPYLWSQARIVGGEAFVYPALAACLFTPFALLPVHLADVIATLLCIAAAPTTLVLLGVRDRRLLGLVLLWPMVVAGWQTANVTLWLGLGIAVLWRQRDRPWAAGVIVAILISLKPFTWPLVVWLLATRRFAATRWLAIAALLLNAVAWLVVGPSAIGRYLSLSSRVTRALFREGYGIPALAAHLGVSHALGTAATCVLAAGCVVWCVRSGRRDRDMAGLCGAFALMLVASPLVWNHYFALLLVPVAIARPRLAPVWVVPLALWVCPSDHVQLWQLLMMWGSSVGMLTVCARTSAGPVAARSNSLGPAFRLGVGA